MAVKIVQTILKQNTTVGSLEQVDMLFDFIQPLVHDPEESPEDDDDEEVEPKFSSSTDVAKKHPLLLQRLVTTTQKDCLP